MYCPKCSSENPDHAKFCKQCGFNIKGFLNKPEKESSREVTEQGFWETTIGQFVSGIIIFLVGLMILGGC